jgi:sulfur carrier protein
MKIRVNGDLQDVAGGCTVRGLLLLLGVDGEGVAVALNGSVLRRGDWGETALGDGDVVEIVRAVGGG